MRIAQIAPLMLQVPPPSYGGTELVVSLLTEELVKRGHEVTLFASGDSITAAHLHSIRETCLCTSGIADGISTSDSYLYDLVNATACFELASQFDIIHNHASYPGMMMAGLVSTPVLTTVHIPAIYQNQDAWSRYKGYYNTVSHSAKGNLPDKGYMGVVYNAIDYETFPFTPKSEGYLLFLSTISHVLDYIIDLRHQPLRLIRWFWNAFAAECSTLWLGTMGTLIYLVTGRVRFAVTGAIRPVKNTKTSGPRDFLVGLQPSHPLVVVLEMLLALFLIYTGLRTQNLVLLGIAFSLFLTPFLSKFGWEPKPLSAAVYLPLTLVLAGVAGGALGFFGPRDQYLILAGLSALFF